jgi:hypothetical protein
MTAHETPDRTKLPPIQRRPLHLRLATLDRHVDIGDFGGTLGRELSDSADVAHGLVVHDVATPTHVAQCGVFPRMGSYVPNVRVVASTAIP